MSLLTPLVAFFMPTYQRRNLTPIEMMTVHYTVLGIADPHGNVDSIHIGLEGKDGNPWFVAKDTCGVLGTRTKDISAILDPDEVDSIDLIDSIGRKQKTIIISESGLYSLTMTKRIQVLFVPLAAIHMTQ